MWLLCQDTARRIAESRRLGLRPTDAQLTAFSALEAAGASDREIPRNMRVAGNVAEIRVEGVLTKEPDIFAFLFGGGNTTYRSIISALAIAQSDPAIKSVLLYVDSPGGSVDGLFDMLAAIETFRGSSASKPLSVKAANALSAAYGIAATAGRIDAVNAGSRFGSVGIAASVFLEDDVVDITNTDSPDKRPDVKTEEGKAVIRRELDAIHELFADAIARGRGTTAEAVNEKFGRGATVLAGEAKKRGMIDSIAKPALRAVGGAQRPAAEGGAQEGDDKQMDLRTLRASHPDVYEAAVAEGVKSERDRVDAHLTMAEPLGADGMAIAVAAIRGGDSMTMTAMARYQVTAMNRGDRNTRQQESDAAAAAVDGAAAAADAKPAAAQEDMGDKVVAILKKRGGVSA
jgi:ClpP class serine protease